MTPGLALLIDRARTLAWYPHTNFGGRRAHLYQDRKDAHAAVVEALESWLGWAAPPEPELRSLVAAIARVAACTFSNRYGLPYAERRQAMAQLRGCFDAWDRQRGAEPLAWPAQGARRGRHARAA